jgi:hypothetical protein
VVSTAGERRKGGLMDPLALQDFKIRLDDWIGQGYKVFADDIDGELRLTAHYVTSASGRSSEREQEFWPMAPEILELLAASDVTISRALAGPRPWAGPHPEEWEQDAD